MTKIASLLTLLITAFICLLPAASAQATGAARTFLSAAGNDANNCTNVATPCRHLATAFAATAADGEIYVLDPANYGSLTITHAVSIEGHGWASIAPVSGGNAITINANPGDAINIIGVVLDGTALASTNGIVFNSGGILTVADSVVRNFHSSGSGETTGNAILLAPTSGTVNFAITNTIVANSQIGILYSPPSGSPAANIVIDHVTATGNSFIEININLLNATGGSAVAAISNSTVSNGGHGIDLDNNTLPLTMSIDNVNVVGSLGNGIIAFGTSKVLLGRSVITGSFFSGISNQTSPNTFFTYKDNRINENGTDICNTGGCLPLNTTLALQ
jgi:hypothetical protein